MEHNKKLKQTLREELPLPQSLGWEQMQEGIFEQMAQPERKRRGLFIFLHWKRIAGAALLVLNFSVMAYLFYLVQEKEQLGAIPIESILPSDDLIQEQSGILLEKPTNSSRKKEQAVINTSKNSSSIEQNITYKNTLFDNSLKKSSDKITAVNNSFKPIRSLEKEVY